MLKLKKTEKERKENYTGSCKFSYSSSTC